MICEATIFSMFAPRLSMLFVSIPARASNSAMSSEFFGRPTNSRSQLTENFIFSQSFRAKSRNPAALSEDDATGCLDVARHHQTVSRELFQKAQVVLREESDIRN